MYPDSTIEDQQINAMHAALERSRAFIKARSEELRGPAEFSIRLSKPRWVDDDDDSPVRRHYCDAQVTVRIRATV